MSAEGIYWFGRRIYWRSNRPPRCWSHGCRGNAHLRLQWTNEHGERRSSRVCGECADMYLFEIPMRSELVDSEICPDSTTQEKE